MMRQSRWLCGLASLLLGAATFVGLAGCFCVPRPEDPTVKEQRRLAEALPKSCRNHCFLFFLHGFDPFDSTDLSGLAQRLKSLGYIKTYEAQYCTNDDYMDEIRHIHDIDPYARFVILGDGPGAQQARDLAGVVQPDGVTIDLLVYFNAAEKLVKSARPRNVLEIVNFEGSRSAGDGAALDHVMNVALTDVSMSGQAVSPTAVELLLRELLQVAGRVPVIVKTPTPDPYAEPTPRPVKALPDGPSDEWDFLKPVSPGAPQSPPTQAPQPLPATPPPGGGPTATTNPPAGNQGAAAAKR
jgi:hypothetical protein